MRIFRAVTRFLPNLFYLCTGVLGLLCFQGKGSHALYILIWLLALGLACWDRRFRQKLRQKIESWKAQAQGYATAKSPTKTPWAAAFFLVGVPTLFFSLVNGRAITSYDNYGSLLTTASIVESGTVEVSHVLGGRAAAENQCKTSYWIVCMEKGVYSSYPAGMVPVLFPVFAVGKLLGADLMNHRVLWRLAKWSSSWLAAMLMMLFLVIALRAAPLKACLWASAFLLTGSAILSTVSQGPWTHGGVLLGMMVALYIALTRKELTWTEAACIGLAWSFMLGGRLLSAVLIVPLFLWLAVRDVRKTFFAAAVCGLGLMPWFFYYWQVYNHALGPQYILLNSLHGGFALKNFPEGFHGLLASPCAGLLIYQPWVILLALYFKYGKTALLPRGWTVLCVSLFTALLITMSLWFGWTGQACWGTRYLTESMPVLGLLVLGPLRMITARRTPAYLWVCLVLAFLIQANGTYGSGRFWIDFPLDKNQSGESRCLDWKDPAFSYPFHRWIFYR